MLSWLVGWQLRRAMAALNAGDIRPALKAYAADAELVFPGEGRFGGTHRGRDEIGAFLKRFVDARLQIEPAEIVAKGAPWNMRIFVRFVDRATSPAGDVVYENEGVIYCRARWGKVFYQRDFLDAQKVAAYDEYLSAREASASPA